MLSMLEYFHNRTLAYLTSSDLHKWTGSPRPHEYLLLLHTARLLQNCPTFVALQRGFNWSINSADRRPLLLELGLPAESNNNTLHQSISRYLDAAWPVSNFTYRFNNRDYYISARLTARLFWQCLAEHGASLLVTVDPNTLHLTVRLRSFD
jgi:hypothetical protein